MKELSIEEKAKRYDEAIKRVENIKTGKCKTTFMFTEGLFEHIFPELAESEDERVMRELIDYFGGMLNGEDVEFPSKDTMERWAAWLKKQGEQKPVAWSEDDENCINYILINCMHYAEKCGHVEELHNDELHKQAKEWLKSLKNRYTWKPSDKQLEAVRIAAEIGTANDSWAMHVLEGLYTELKKLKG